MTPPRAEGPLRLADDPTRPQLAKLLDHPPVPPPPPGAKDRSWRAVSAGLSPRTPGRSLWVAAVLGPALAAALLWVVAPPGLFGAAVEVGATVTPLVGAVELSAPAEASGRIDSESRLQEGGRVVSGPGARAILRFAGAVAELGEGASLRIRRLSKEGDEVALEAGLLAVRVLGNATTQRPLTVHGARVWVEGVSFSVQVAADGLATVTSFEGSTVVRSQGSAVRIDAGGSWSEPAPISAAEVAEKTDSPRSEPKAALPPTLVARRAPPKPIKVSVEPAAVGDEAPDDSAAEAVPENPGTANEHQAEAELWAAATRAIRERRPGDALAPLERLAAADGSYAGVALYELGRVKARYLNDAPGAQRAFLEYRTRFPAGPLGAEVEVSMAELLLGQGALDEAERMLEALLARQPGGSRVAELRLLRAHVWRERGDCEAAAGEYLALGSGGGRIGGDALYYGAFCEQKLGRWDAARTSLEAYLARHPQGRFRADAQRALNLF